MKNLVFRPEDPKSKNWAKKNGWKSLVQFRQTWQPEYANHWSSLYERRTYSTMHPLNVEVLCRIYGHMHYLTSHSPRRNRSAIRAMDIRYLKRTRSKFSKLNDIV